MREISDNVADKLQMNLHLEFDSYECEVTQIDQALTAVIQAYLTECWHDNTVYPEVPKGLSAVKVFIETKDGLETFIRFPDLNKQWFKSNVIRWAYPADIMPEGM